MLFSEPVHVKSDPEETIPPHHRYSESIRPKIEPNDDDLNRFNDLYSQGIFSNAQNTLFMTPKSPKSSESFNFPTPVSSQCGVKEQKPIPGNSKFLFKSNVTNLPKSEFLPPASNATIQKLKWKPLSKSETDRIPKKELPEGTVYIQTKNLTKMPNNAQNSTAYLTEWKLKPWDISNESKRECDELLKMPLEELPDDLIGLEPKHPQKVPKAESFDVNDFMSENNKELREIVQLDHDLNSFLKKSKASKRAKSLSKKPKEDISLSFPGMTVFRSQSKIPVELKLDKFSNFESGDDIRIKTIDERIQVTNEYATIVYDKKSKNLVIDALVKNLSYYDIRMTDQEIFGQIKLVKY